MLAIATSLSVFVAQLTNAYKVPCYLDQNLESGPANCEVRHRNCGYYASNPPSVNVEYTLSGASHCADDRNANNYDPPLRRGLWYVVQWTDRNDQCYEILMQAGECWGKDIYRLPAMENMNYNCQGRCGNGCEQDSGLAVCSNWARDCLRHDVCRYFHANNGAGSDPDCGDEYNDGVDDFTACCAGSYFWNKWSCNRCELYDSNRKNLQSSYTCDNPGFPE